VNGHDVPLKEWTKHKCTTVAIRRAGQGTEPLFHAKGDKRQSGQRLPVRIAGKQVNGQMYHGEVGHTHGVLDCTSSDMVGRATELSMGER